MHGDFFGRAGELAWLRMQFEACAGVRGARGPRLAVLLGEPGIGKTRLVQQLHEALRAHPEWNPPACRAWHAAFGPGTTRRDVMPLTGRKRRGRTPRRAPKEPPRFLWLGARAVPPLPGLPGLPGLACVPGARRGPMQDGLLAGLHAVVAEQAAALAGAPAACIPPTPADADAGRLLLEALHGLLAQPQAIPTVLWLDDAQHLDAESVACVARLWSAAKQHGYPLLLVLCHGKDEWASLPAHPAEGGSPTLRDLAQDDLADSLTLKGAPAGDLAASLACQLPGLTATQRDLLVAAACGNFLTLAEDVAELRARAHSFEGGHVGAPLTPQAEALLHGRAVPRPARIARRFLQYAREAGDVLGWTSGPGLRFLHEVALGLAREHLPRLGLERMLEYDPEAAWGTPPVPAGASTSAGTDRLAAFEEVARRHAGWFLPPLARPLGHVLQQVLQDWVQRSLDAYGDIVGLDDEEASDTGRCDPDVHAADDNAAHDVLPCAMDLPGAERHDLLALAMHELPLPQRPDWSCPVHVAALQAVALMVRSCAGGEQWAQCHAHAALLAEVDWRSVPEAVLSAAQRVLLAGDCQHAGALEAAECLLRDVIERQRAEGGSHRSMDDCEALASLLLRAGCIVAERGALAEGASLQREGITLWRELAQGPGGGPAACASLARGLEGLATTLHAMGEEQASRALRAEAEALHASTLALPDEELPAADRLTHLIQHTLSQQAAGHGDAALASARAAVAAARRLVAADSCASVQRCLVAALGITAEMEMAAGKARAARTKCAEALRLARALDRDEDGPDALQCLRNCLVQMGMLEAERCEHERAVVLQREGLQVARRLARVLGTPASLLQVAGSLESLAIALEDTGDDEGALAAHGEALSLRRRVARTTCLVQARAGLATSHFHMGRIASEQDADARAARHLRSSLRLRKALLARAPSDDLHEQVAWCLAELARVEARMGRPRAARQRGLAALAAWEAVAARHACTVAQAQVAEALQRLGDLAVQAGRMGAGRDFHQRALVVRRALAAIPSHELANHELAASLMMCALLARAAGDTQAALALQDEAVALRHAILPEDPSEQEMRLVLCSATLMSMCQMDLERPAEALATLAAATPMAERLSASAADDRVALDACVTYWEAVADAALAVGDEPARAHATARAEQVRASLPDEG